MSQFWIENIYEQKRINNANFFSKYENKLNISNDLCSIDYANHEEENIKIKNPLDSELINEDMNRGNESYQLNELSFMNSINIKNVVEQKNISSMNTTNENKYFDFFIKAPSLSSCYKDLLNKKKIFEINKVNKKLGRLKKNSIISGKHSKLAEDNIIRKIKRRFLENIRIYINKEYKNYRLEMNKITNRKNWLKKINPKFSCSIKKNENLKWFSLKVYEVFSNNLSLRYSSQNLDLNKRNIQNLFSLNESSKLKDILNTSIEALYSKYIANEKFGDFKTLDDDLKELEKQMKKSGQEDINEYLNKYRNVAINLKSIFMKKSGRNRRKK